MNRSVTSGEYHQVRFSEGSRFLWNPARKSMLKDRPEERVRLRCMEWLHFRCGVSFSRMSTELPVRGRISDDTRRADILTYDKDVRPRLLVECKSEHVPVDAKAAIQAAHYNETVKAPYLMLTNGSTDAFYDMTGPKPEPLTSGFFDQERTRERDFSYWMERGFIGHQAEESRFLTGLLEKMFVQDTVQIRYMQILASGLSVPLNHYFHPVGTNFITLSGRADGSTWAAGLITDESGKKSITLVPLDESFGQNGLILRASGPSSLPEHVNEKARLLIASEPEPGALNNFLCSL